MTKRLSVVEDDEPAPNKKQDLNHPKFSGEQRVASASSITLEIDDPNVTRQGGCNLNSSTTGNFTSGFLNTGVLPLSIPKSVHPFFNRISTPWETMSFLLLVHL